MRDRSYAGLLGELARGRLVVRETEALRHRRARAPAWAGDRRAWSMPPLRVRSKRPAPGRSRGRQRLVQTLENDPCLDAHGVRRRDSRFLLRLSVCVRPIGRRWAGRRTVWWRALDHGLLSLYVALAAALAPSSRQNGPMWAAVS